MVSAWKMHTNHNCQMFSHRVVHICVCNSYTHLGVYVYIHFVQNLYQLCLITCSANILKHIVFQEFTIKTPA